MIGPTTVSGCATICASSRATSSRPPTEPKRRLRAEAETAAILLVAVTATVTLDADPTLRDTFDAILRKPVSRAEWLGRLARWLTPTPLKLRPRRALPANRLQTGLLGRSVHSHGISAISGGALLPHAGAYQPRREKWRNELWGQSPGARAWPCLTGL